VKPKALIVEDEQDLGGVVAEHLKDWGFEPTHLLEGKNVVGWARQHRPQFILLDLMLPDIDGFSICEMLKLDRDTNLIPVIMTTALAEREDRLRGLQVGANIYLTKPFTAETLRQAIHTTLQWLEDLKSNGTRGEISFHLQSDTQFLAQLNQMLMSLFLFTGLEPKQIRQLTTAVREIGTNAIEWGHQKQIERIVTVDYRIDAEKITIDIKDTGPGFNPGDVPHAARLGDPVTHMSVRENLGLREGGFGIMMSRGLVDAMSYNGKGNEVRLIKYFSRQSAAGQAASESVQR
jgi:CheY-like chemotaxis protein/anti-sigma regulatory factor (Ser/Thr protein kinase)